MKKNIGQRVLSWCCASILIAIPGFSASATLESINLVLPSKAFAASGSQRAAKKDQLASALELAPEESLDVISTNKDLHGREHRRYQQFYRGLPILGLQVITHESNGDTRVSGKIMRGLKQDLNRYFKASPSSSLVAKPVDYAKLAESWLRKKYFSTLPNQKISWRFEVKEQRRAIWMAANGDARVVHEITLIARSPSQSPQAYSILIDEEKQQVLDAWDAFPSAQATGPGGNEKTGAYYFGVDYGPLAVLEEGADCLLRSSRVVTIDMEDGFNPENENPFRFPCYENTERSINGAFSPLNDAHFFGHETLEMYEDWLGVVPFDQPVRLYVHYGFAEADAFWDGVSANFGNGDDAFYPMTDINVVAHEISHGFTEKFANLKYSGQSGGINEAFSDIAAEALELYVNGTVDWYIGYGVVKNAEALRYFNDPTLDGLSIRDARNYKNDMNVHYSSGVYNQAFYWLANEPGWTLKDGFLVFAHANQNYWIPDTDFNEGVCGLINAARDLALNPSAIVLNFAKVGAVCSSDLTDSDNDGLPDGWEVYWGFNPFDGDDAQQDPDADNLTNLEEFINKTRPDEPDSDGDGLDDGAEVNVHNTDPLSEDSDGDTMPDPYEVSNGLDPNEDADAGQDKDNDGFTNLTEYELLSNPSDKESIPIQHEQFLLSFENGVPGNFILTANTDDVPAWASNSQWAVDGSLSYSVGDIGDGNYSTATFKLWVVYGDLSFNHKISTEADFDFLEFWVNGRQIERLSGEQEGIITHRLESGVHQLQFVYRKDASAAGIEDRVWIDNVRFQAVDNDRDDDGLPNDWELLYGFDPDDPSDASLDSDLDGLSNLEEFESDANPRNSDSDGDGLLDGEEVNEHGTSPTDADTDADGMLDGFEVDYGLDPTALSDGAEDADNDGVSNLNEYLMGTLPNDSSSVPVIQQNYFESFEAGIPENWEIKSGAPRQDDQWYSDGTHSLIFSEVADGQQAAVELRQLYRRGVLNFDYRVSSEEEFDFFRVYIDGELVLQESGEKEDSVSFSLSEGVHDVRFVYQKDFNELGNLDSVWIDRIEFIQEGPDADGDGMPTEWELEYGLDPYDSADKNEDDDQDGYDNLTEYQQGTHPKEANIDIALTFKQINELNFFKISYKVTLTNVGQVKASNVLLTHGLPKRLLETMRFVVPQDGSVECYKTEESFACKIEQLAVDSSAELRIDVFPRNGLALHGFSGELSADQVDANPNNNNLAVIYAGSVQWFSLFILLGFALLRRKTTCRA